MKRVLFVSMIGQPGRYDASIYSQLPGGDNEVHWFFLQLRALGLDRPWFHLVSQLQVAAGSGTVLVSLYLADRFGPALAAQLASQAAYQPDDVPGAIAYLKQVIQFNGLDNNGHFQSMLMLGQLQLQEDKTAEGLATLDKYFAESKSTKPEELIAKGQALYQLERYQEAIPVLKQAIAGAAEPKDNWNQLLMAALSEAGQTGEAVQAAEALAAKNPTDKKAQLNLANMYMQADQMPKAAAAGATLGIRLSSPYFTRRSANKSTAVMSTSAKAVPRTMP